MAPKEISVKNLANIIQARMSEILDFVTYHLKQVGLDNKLLNGGIILTGGGSQLKHLLQLTEYITGLNARIGLPNEHLAGGHIEELAKPMYSTCLGLILKGYNDYENNSLKSGDNFFKVEKSDPLVSAPKVELPKKEEQPPSQEPVKIDNEKRAKTIKDFLDSIKNNLIELFKEDDDMKF
jgi:cell division protein FtsA